MSWLLLLWHKGEAVSVDIPPLPSILELFFFSSAVGPAPFSFRHVQWVTFGLWYCTVQHRTDRLLFAGRAIAQKHLTSPTVDMHVDMLAKIRDMNSFSINIHSIVLSSSDDTITEKSQLMKVKTSFCSSQRIYASSVQCWPFFFPSLWQQMPDTHTDMQTHTRRNCLADGFRGRRITHRLNEKWEIRAIPPIKEARQCFVKIFHDFLVWKSANFWRFLLSELKSLWCLSKRGGVLYVWSCHLLSRLAPRLLLCVTNVMSQGLFVWHLRSGNEQWHFLVSSTLTPVSAITIHSKCLCDKCYRRYLPLTFVGKTNSGKGD